MGPTDGAGGDDRAGSVRLLFAAVARRYDLANRVMSGFLDGRWRRQTIEWIAPRPGESILDMACGTGELALALARVAGPCGRVVGVDFCEEMLDTARAKQAARPCTSTAPLEWLLADARRTGLPGGAFDAVTCAFGLRNMMDDLRVVLGEIRRLLRPGGRLGVLEFSLPRRCMLRWGELAWLRLFVPLIGGCLTGRFEPYRYLAQTIRQWDRGVNLSDALVQVGFADVVARSLSGGIVTFHGATRP